MCFCVHICMSPSNDYTALACSINNQAQFTHSRISFLLISRSLSRYFLGLELLRDIQFRFPAINTCVIRTESGCGSEKFRSRPLSTFLNPPLIYMLVNNSLYLYSLLFSPSSPLQPLFKKMKLMEACRYGLVDQLHYFIKTGVNVNMADFVSCVSTCEGCIMYMNSCCMHVYSQYVGKRWRIQSWD